MTPLFLDTGFLIALESSDDQHHQAAHRFWRTYLNDPTKLITTSFIIDEAETFFNARGHHAKALEIGNYLMTSKTIQLIYITEEQFVEGWHWLERHQDKRYSLTDCISFVVMKQLKVKAALTFDKHFAQAGLQMMP